MAGWNWHIGPKHDWHRYATAQHVKLYWETQCNSRKRRYNNETKWLDCTAFKADARCLEVWSPIDGNNFLQRLPEDSHANKLQQVLVDSWTAPIPIASLSCFEHGKMSIQKKHWIVEAQKFFDIVTSAEDCKHSYRNQAQRFETAFYCWCHDTLSRLSMVSLSSWHSGQWRWHCRLRSGGQTVRATQQEGWNGGYLVSFQMSAAVMGLAGCTMLRLAVVLKSLGWSLKDASPNPTWIRLCSRIGFVDEMLMSVCGFCMIIFDRSGQAFIFLEEDGARLGEEMGAMKWHDSMKRLDRSWLIGWCLCVDAVVAWIGA